MKRTSDVTRGGAEIVFAEMRPLVQCRSSLFGPTANFCADAITVRLSEEQLTTSARCEHFGP
jgi:hypothetical protein